MKRSLFLCLFAGALIAAPPAPDPAAAGMDASELAKIPPRMKAFVDSEAIAGVVTLVMRHGAVAQVGAEGWQDLEARKPMRTDTIFQIMSMTKPVTGVAVMMMVEEGKLRLNDPVERILPEFRGQWVIVSEEGGKRTLAKPARPITVRDLMSHTSGLCSNSPPAIADVLVSMKPSLADAVLIYSQTPLEFEPGSRWVYSNAGIATLGRIVEVLSGMSFEKFVETRIFQPLGMQDSHIFLPAEKHSRLSPVYTVKDGKLTRAPSTILAGDPMAFRKGAVYSGPEFAMYSTASDLAQFYSMMLAQGTYNSKRLISPNSVAVMTSLQTGDLKAGHNPGTGFGLTWEVTKDNMGILTGQSIGTFGHGGAFGTYGWVDPKKDIVGVFMVQISGNAGPVRDAFVEMVNSAVVEARKQ
jgi:CubicO group peptidase (beta-lactamase class C family)